MKKQHKKNKIFYVEKMKVKANSVALDPPSERYMGMPNTGDNSRTVAVTDGDGI